MRRVLPAAVLLLLILAPRPTSAQLLTGAITGAVSDHSGAVMPGVTVTVTGDTLIGRSRNLVTGGRGDYRFDNLPPGDYDLVFELAGFHALERKGIRISAGFVATINVSLEVGAIEERVVVTGESPTVDTKSNVQQTVMGQEVLESVPTGRDVWSLAKIIPGVTVSTYDVGGTQGMQQSGMSARGSRDQNFTIDGLSVNWPGGGGGSTMLYYDQGMFEEVNYQTSAIPAEVDIGGVYMNMVTKAGGNAWKGEARYYYGNDALQAENFAEVSAKYKFPGGNPVVKQYDFNGSAAGPVLKDRIWFFGSFRRWRVDKKLLSAFNPDGTNAIDDNMIWNGSGKISAQFTPNHRLGLVYNYNEKNRYHRRGGQSEAPETFIEDKATTVQEQPGYATQGKYTAVLGGTSVFESTIGIMAGTYPERYQKEVTSTDIRRSDSVLDTATGAAWANYENPNYRFQFNNTFSHARQGWGGSHNFKAGVQFTRMFYREITRMNYDMRLIYANRVPVTARAFNTPVTATSYVHQLGFFGQDSWSPISRLTLNVGFRVDRAVGWLPDQSSAAGRWVPERTVEKKDVYKQSRPVWRLGAVYDVFGNGRTAIKANVSRYAQQVGIGLVTSVHPFSLSAANIAWSDANGNNFPEPGELGKFEGFTGGATTRYADSNGPDWGYSDEMTAGVEHQLISDVRLGVTVYRRTNRKITGSRNTAVPPTAYTQATVAHPLGGTMTIFNLDPAYVGKQQNLREAVDLLDTNYTGVETTLVKHFSHNWQMMFGATFGRNKGGLSFGDMNDPNNLINQQGIVGNDSTRQFRLSGTYLIPKVGVAVSGSFIHNTGYPRQFTYAVTRAAFPGLTRSTQTVRVNTSGDERLPNVMLIDLRFSRPIKFAGNRVIEPQIDVFNVANNDVIVRMVDAIGPRLGYPSEILAPRIIRLGCAIKF